MPHPRPDDKLHIDTGRTGMVSQAYGVAQQNLIFTSMNEQRWQVIQPGIMWGDQWLAWILIANIVRDHGIDKPGTKHRVLAGVKGLTSTGEIGGGRDAHGGSWQWLAAIAQ